MPLCLMVLPKFPLARAFVPPGPSWALIRPAHGQLRSFDTLPLCAWQWTVGILEFTAPVLWAVGSGDPAAHCHPVVGSGGPSVHYLAALGSGQWGSCSSMPHRSLGVVGSGTPIEHCLTIPGQ